MRHPRTCLLLGWGLALAAAVAAPAAGQIVARIGDTEIDLTEFEDRALALRKTGYEHLQTLDMKAKRQLMDGIVAQELLVLEGYRQGVDQDTVIAADLARHERRALMNALYDTQALHGDYTDFTDEELRQYFHDQQYDVEVLSSHIVCATEADARAVLAGLADGKSFESLLPTYTLPDILTRFGPTGNVGWFRVGSLYPELIEPLATMPVGEVYPEPVQTDRGYHVVRLDVRRPVSFESSADFVREKLRVQKRANDMEAYVNGLRQRYRIRLDEKGMRALAAIPKSTESSASTQTVVTWKGGHLTVADYMDLVRAGRALHPAELDEAGLDKSVDNFAGQQVMMAEARRLGLDKRPEVRRKTEDRRRELFAKWLYQKEAKRRAQVDTSPERVRRFYEDNLDLYTRDDGQVADLSVVAGSIRGAMQRHAEQVAMDAFIGELRERFADQIHIDEAVLARAFADAVSPAQDSN